MESAKTLLRDVFGFKKFRPGQREIIDAVACGENAVSYTHLTLPTILLV